MRVQYCIQSIILKLNVFSCRLGRSLFGGAVITPRRTVLMSDITGEHESAALLLDVKHWDTRKEFRILRADTTGTHPEIRNQSHRLRLEVGQANINTLLIYALAPSVVRVL